MSLRPLKKNWTLELSCVPPTYLLIDGDIRTFKNSLEFLKFNTKSFSKAKKRKKTFSEENITKSI